MLSSQMRSYIRAQARKTMTQTCEIWAETNSVNELGSPSRVWQIIDQDVPCLLITAKIATNAMTETVASQEVMEDSYRLCLPYDTVLTTDMRIVVEGATYNVAFILDRRGNNSDVQAMVIRMRTP
jgi:SPP1 family predicted phage head-tail adaptor